MGRLVADHAFGLGIERRRLLSLDAPSGVILLITSTVLVERFDCVCSESLRICVSVRDPSPVC